MAELSHASTSSSSNSTISSAQPSSSSASISSLGNKFRQSFGLDPVVPTAHAHVHRHHRVNLDRVAQNPIELAEMATAALFTIPGPPMDELREKILPRFFFAGYPPFSSLENPELTFSFSYVHRVNAREMSLDKLLSLVVLLRARFATMRIRFKSSLEDMDGSCSLDNPAGCAVGITYDIIATPLHSSVDSMKKEKKKGKDSNSHSEEVRGSAMEIVKIYQGRIAQGDLVLDTKDLQMSNQTTELSCSIM